ncbi:glycoside hydrolase family 16 protein [Coprinellus micaceus]|uniref:Glycoside hydrolase family 16 protein n=1 Tax=Coprinellus micaceus TaxID=71717 RepID=A0A4Y7TU02_COPMI|nr:glycoside hydrolase family 16 protein [Coprinellus micaceus]
MVLPRFITAVLVLLILPLSIQAATYNAIKEYSGATFLDDWDFYGHYDDKMNGDVNFVTAAQGVSEKLAYVDPNTSRTILKVDNTTTVPYPEKRNAVRITSKQSHEVGSLWVADIYHAPYGCSVWPAFWSFAQDAAWPAGGEIDTFEGVNLHPTAQMGLHTEGSAGCSQINPTQLSTLVNTTDCAGTNNAGCMVTNTNPNSYGAAFAQQQGGVFITEFAESGISIWFYSRKDIPSSVTQGATSIDTSTLGTPMGNWPAAGCDINKAFQPQNLVFTVTLCGDFARPENIFTQTCTGKCYDDWVIKDPSSYDNAYFDISYVKVFSTNPSATQSSATTSSGATGTQTGAQASSSNRSDKLKVTLLSVPVVVSAMLDLLML